MPQMPMTAAIMRRSLDEGGVRWLLAPAPVVRGVPRIAVPEPPVIATPLLPAAPSLPEMTAPLTPPVSTRRPRVVVGN